MKQSYVLLEDRLNSEYKEVFDRIDLYGETHFIDVDLKSEKLMELLDSMLTAQNEGVEVSRIVGNDLEAFCEEFYSDYTVEGRLKKIPDRLFKILIWTFLIEVLDFIFALISGESILRNSDLAPYFIGLSSGIIVDFIVILLVRPLAKKYKRIKPVFWEIFMVIMLLTALITTVEICAVNGYDIEIKSIIIIGITGGYICIYKICQMINNYKKYGTVKGIKNKKYDAEISYKEAVKSELEISLPEEWLKKYRKMHKKAINKGKNPITEEEYIKKLSKQYDYKKFKLQNILIFGGISVIVVLVMIITDSFESVSDGLIYTGILCIIEGSLYKSFNKLEKNTSRIFMKMKESLETGNITLEEYVEKKNRILEETENQ